MVLLSWIWSRISNANYRKRQLLKLDLFSCVEKINEETAFWKQSCWKFWLLLYSIKAWHVIGEFYIVNIIFSNLHFNSSFCTFACNPPKQSNLMKITGNISCSLNIDINQNHYFQSRLASFWKMMSGCPNFHMDIINTQSTNHSILTYIHTYSHCHLDLQGCLSSQMILQIKEQNS